MPDEELGIIRRPGYGMRDAPCPVLWFEVHMLYNVVMHIAVQPEADAFIKEAGIADVKDLDGKGVVVERNGNMARVLRLFDC
jgi:hypothetical protein